MARLIARARFIIGAWVVLLALAIALPASAQQPSSVNPTASAVKEQQLLNALQGGSISGRVSIPDQKSANLIQPGGRDWRQFHEVTLRWIGAIAVLGMLILLVAFYLDPRSGEARERLFGPAHRSLQCVRTRGALDGGDLLHHPGDLGAQHHLRQAVADAADRRERVRRLGAMGEVCAQLSQLPVHHRRCSASS